MLEPETNRSSDAQAIERSLADPSRFEVVFDRHYDTIHRYVARRLGSPVADDLASEVFVQAFTARSRFTAPPGGSCLPWLYGITSNTMRHESRRRLRESRAVRRVTTSGHVQDVSTDVAWSVDAQRRVEESGLIDAMNDLPPDDRETFYLYAVAEASYAEVAEALEVPLGTVRSRLARVRQKLRAALETATGSEEMS
ncbi:MAG: RNA polymerase sigma factor [Actinomycetota bacterium]|nr:RNA polymerase sigma factor [Actinomycetota bacterium]